MENKLLTWIRNNIESICLKLENSVLSDKSLKCKVVFGPVHSRRLGTVLGINNVKPGLCSYNCIYCPGGKTSCCSVCTNNCLSPYELYIAVKNKLREIKSTGKKIEYILFSGSGDPCLDSSLSKEIFLLRELGYKIAVFTNSSLLWNKSIQENLMFADYVSVKIDTVNESTWLKINRPHQRLRYNLILEGIQQFANNFKGILTTESTLIKNVNDNSDEIIEISRYLNSLPRNASYFMTPVYPPSEDYAVSPTEETLKLLTKAIKENISNAVLLCCPNKEEFIATYDFENELLGLLALHPVSESAIINFAADNNKKEKLYEMLSSKIIRIIEFNGKKYLGLNNTI